MVPIMVPMLDTVVDTDEVRLWRSAYSHFVLDAQANQLSLTYGTYAIKFQFSLLVAEQPSTNIH